MSINERINQLAVKIANETTYPYINMLDMITTMLSEGCSLDRIQQEYEEDGIVGVETYRTINFMGLDF